MAVTPEKAAQIRQAYESFKTLAGDKYVDSQKNCDAIKKLMIDSGFSLEGAGIAVDAWTSFWIRASAAGLLEEPAAPLTKEQLAQKEAERLHKLGQRDRYEGSMAGNKIDAPLGPAEEARRRKDAEDTKARIETTKQKAEAQKAREAAQAALVVPTAAQLIAGEYPMAGALSAQEADRYTGEQLRTYFFNSRQAQSKIEFERNADREQRRREHEKANA
jgi:hypothetical protein